MFYLLHYSGISKLVTIKGSVLTDQIKNRVVGTVVLFTLAIIFLPDIFDGKKNELKEEFAVIPAKPVIKHAPQDLKSAKSPVATADNEPMPSPTPSLNESNAAQLPTKNGSEQAKTTPLPQKSQVEAKPFKDSGWVIQMGIFKQASSVKPYLAELRAKGFNAFSVPNAPRSGEATTVYIGPDLNKANLVKLQPRLKALFKESGYIKKFNPTSEYSN